MRRRRRAPPAPVDNAGPAEAALGVEADGLPIVDPAHEERSDDEIRCAIVDGVPACARGKPLW